MYIVYNKSNRREVYSSNSIRKIQEWFMNNQNPKNICELYQKKFPWSWPAPPHRSASSCCDRDSRPRAWPPGLRIPSLPTRCGDRPAAQCPARPPCRTPGSWRSGASRSVHRPRSPSRTAHHRFRAVPAWRAVRRIPRYPSPRRRPCRRPPA